jgi:hypothetical protein
MSKSAWGTSIKPSLSLKPEAAKDNWDTKANTTKTNANFIRTPYYDARYKTLCFLKSIRLRRGVFIGGRYGAISLGAIRVFAH